jgi:hypothetical protein
VSSYDANEISVEGTLRVVGNEPFTALVLDTESHVRSRYLVAGDRATELRAHQQERVSLTGTIEKSRSPYAQQAIRVRAFAVLR